MSRPRAVFFGTPEFAVPGLEALTEVATVTRVFSQPDRPQGRGLAVVAPAVKRRAVELGIPVSQPVKVKTREFAAEVEGEGADVALVIAFGRILPRAVLDAPRRGCVNVHASLLPRWRGAAPIQWAVLAGDAETGVTLMQMDEGLDTGPILAERRTAIGPNETSGELFVRLAALGGELVREALPRHLRGELVARPQAAEGVTLARILEKADGAMDWSRSSLTLHNLVRGLHPWPGTFTRCRGVRIKVHRAVPVAGARAGAEPGTVLRADRHGIDVQCGEGALSLLELQADGKRRLGHAEFLSGFPLAPGVKFESAVGA